MFVLSRNITFVHAFDVHVINTQNQCTKLWSK